MVCIIYVPLFLRFFYRRFTKQKFDSFDYVFLIFSLVGLFWIFFKKNDSYPVAEAVGNSFCIPTRSPKTFEEDIDQQTRGYQNLQKYKVKDLVQKMPEYTTEKGINPDDDQVNLNIDLVKTAPQGDDLLDHGEEFAVGVFKQVVYTLPGATPPLLRRAGSATALKGGLTSNISYNLFDKAFDKGEEGIRKTFSSARRKSEETKKDAK